MNNEHFAGSIAFFGNYFVLRIFGHTQSLRTPANMLVMNLAFSDLLLTLCMFPECIYNFFTGGPWRFGEMACQIHSFTGITKNKFNKDFLIYRRLLNL